MLQMSHKYDPLDRGRRGLRELEGGAIVTFLSIAGGPSWVGKDGRGSQPAQFGLSVQGFT